jgi:Sulfatase-modifying factor enzyme 1
MASRLFAAAVPALAIPIIVASCNGSIGTHPLADGGLPGAGGSGGTGGSSVSASHSASSSAGTGGSTISTSSTTASTGGSTTSTTASTGGAGTGGTGGAGTGGASCTDHMKDGDETDVDCGGGTCPPCQDTYHCKVGTDCIDKVCSGTPLTCQAPSCTDGQQNGTETDVDCGGTCTKKCGPGAGCGTGPTASANCESQLCTNGTCQATCSDAIQDGTETDVDCGGTCPSCAPGKMCGTAPNAAINCQSGVCAATLVDGGTTVPECQAPTCNDGVKNGTETDIDCGGASCPQCSPGKKCNSTNDCVGNNCESGVCACPNGMAIAPIEGGNGAIYCIDQVEVTYAQYEGFYDANPPTTSQPSYCSWNTTWTPSGNWPQGPTNQADPVRYTNWCQAYAYCQYQGHHLCGAISGGPVPQTSFATVTADQWFNACTAGGSNVYPYGNTYNSGVCGGADIDGGSPGPLPSTSLSFCLGGETGLLEMSGNVAEWEDSCDSYGPTNPDLAQCSIRGGSYLDHVGGLRCDSGQAAPVTKPRSYSQNDVGFRCCL